MKARSVVLTTLEPPFTVMGMPPKLLALNLGVVTASYIACWASGLVSISIIVLALVAVIGLALSFKAARKDRHIETVVLTTQAFWRGKTRRVLLAGWSPTARLAGAASTRSRGGRR